MNVSVAVGARDVPIDVAGVAMRMKSARFRKEIRKSPQLQREVNRYTGALMAQITQTAGCNRFHIVEERLARWLLMTRVGSGEFRLTHEFLGHMLGVRRVGVTKAAHATRTKADQLHPRQDQDPQPSSP